MNAPQVALILLVLLPLTLLMPNYAPWNLLQASRRRADFASDAEGGDGGAEEGGAGAEHAAHRQQRRQDQALADASASGAASGGRKMMTEAIPLPGAHLKHLVLVSVQGSGGPPATRCVRKEVHAQLGVCILYSAWHGLFVNRCACVAACALACVCSLCGRLRPRLRLCRLRGTPCTWGATTARPT